MIELRRGDIILASDRGDYTGKLRPMLVVQRNSTLPHAAGVTACGMTTVIAATEPMRVAVLAGNGVDEPSLIMIDKISTIRRERVRSVVGRLPAAKMQEVDRALRRWLDL